MRIYVTPRFSENFHGKILYNFELQMLTFLKKFGCELELITPENNEQFNFAKYSNVKQTTI